MAARVAAHPGSSSSTLAVPIPSNVPPPTGAGTTVPRPVSDARDPRDSVVSPSAPPTGNRTEARPGKSSTSGSWVAPPASVNGSSSSSIAVPRAANSARFIAANPTERRIDLGADGRLPELILLEGGSSEPAAGNDRTSNPLVLVAVLTISFGLSAAMLFIDTGTRRRSESDRKTAAREELILHYTKSHRRPEPYQELLRQALQFHNQGKYADELRCYRRVLDLLHEEHRENLRGLTGVRRGVSPPSDEHLESLLSQLLSND